MKTVKFYTLGCKVNQYDTQSIRERFVQKGFKELTGEKPAAIYVINTCTVTQKADSESLWLLRKAKKENPKATVIMTGCLVEKNRKFLSKLKGADIVISKNFFPDGISDFYGRTRAFLKIQDGCNNYCSYCIVPLARGRSRSRLIGDIVKEARCLAKKGFKEIVLTGVNLGSFGKDLKHKISLVDLIADLERIKGVLRIRLSSIEAKDVSDELIDKIAGSRKICRHLHIPLQSGDNNILKKMNRKYRSGDYLKLIKKLRKRIPGITITTDCLVGFPGENEKSFNNTASLIRKIMPLKVHIFPYSPRAGTVANNYDNKLDSPVIKNMVLRLEKIGSSLAINSRRKFINKRMDVLIETRSKHRPGFWQGYTDNYIKAHVKSKKNLKNKLISCLITAQEVK